MSAVLDLPVATPDGAPAVVGGLDAGALRRRLAGDGLRLDLGAMSARVRTPFADLADALHRLYARFPLLPDDGFDDFAVDVVPSPGLKGRLRPSLRVLVDGLDPFGAQPREFALPQLEWGMNWCFATAFDRHLLLHAASADVAGTGVLLAGTPGSGKSTLAAALAMSGHRLLSDEFGVLRLDDRRLLPLPKPVSLKNRSIDAIRERHPDAVIGPRFHKTHKGDVAHMALPAPSVERRHEPVTPRVLVLPRWMPGAALELQPVPPTVAFGELATHSFNVDTLGVAGFDALRGLVDGCSCHGLVYGELDDAIAAIERLCGEGA